MNLSKCILLFVFLFNLQGTTQASTIATDHSSARNLVNTEYKVENRLDKKLTKKLDKLVRKFNKNGAQIDFAHPTDRWLWFSIFGFGLAILMLILNVEFLSGILAFGALVCIIIWIVKKSGV